MTAASAADVRGAGRQSASRPRRRSRPTARAVLLVVVVIALLFAATVPLRTYLSQRNQLARLQHQTQVLEHQSQLLDKQIQQLHDRRYLEQLARACLGMVRPGEIHFAVTGKGVQNGGSQTGGSGPGTPADC
jgi:cell division protein FtsB